MSVLSLSYWESDVYWRQNNKHFAELAPQNGGKQLIWRNYVTVTPCIKPSIKQPRNTRPVLMYINIFLGPTLHWARNSASEDGAMYCGRALCRRRVTCIAGDLAAIMSRPITTVTRLTTCNGRHASLSVIRPALQCFWEHRITPSDCFVLKATPICWNISLIRVCNAGDNAMVEI